MGKTWYIGSSDFCPMLFLPRNKQRQNTCHQMPRPGCSAKWNAVLVNISMWMVLQGMAPQFGFCNHPGPSRMVQQIHGIITIAYQATHVWRPTGDWMGLDIGWLCGTAMVAGASKHNIGLKSVAANPASDKHQNSICFCSWMSSIRIHFDRLLTSWLLWNFLFLIFDLVFPLFFHVMAMLFLFMFSPCWHMINFGMRHVSLMCWLNATEK